MTDPRPNLHIITYVEKLKFVLARHRISTLALEEGMEKKNEKQEMKLHIFVALAMVMFTLKKSKHIIRKL